MRDASPHPPGDLRLLPGHDTAEGGTGNDGSVEKMLTAPGRIEQSASFLNRAVENRSSTPDQSSPVAWEMWASYSSSRASESPETREYEDMIPRRQTGLGLPGDPGPARVHGHGTGDELDFGDGHPGAPQYSGMISSVARPDRGSKRKSRFGGYPRRPFLDSRNVTEQGMSLRIQGLKFLHDLETLGGDAFARGPDVSQGGPDLPQGLRVGTYTREDHAPVAGGPEVGE